MASKVNLKVLSVFTLALINVAAVMNLSQLSILAEYGVAAIFFVGLSSLLFFIPVALVAAELATGWPKAGGMYAWIKEAFGKDWAFLGIWLQWIENVVWYPTILSFTAATIAFVIDPGLVANELYTLAMILMLSWAMTFVNFRGMKLSGMISSFAVSVGVIFPAALVILLGIFWILSGNPMQIEFTAQAAIPDIANVAGLVFFVGVLLGFCGIEMSAFHAMEVKDPQKDFPKAILLSALIILAISVLGSLAIAVVIPQDAIQLNAGIMQAFQYFFNAYNLDWVVPIIAFLVAVGSVGMVSTWIVGPSRGLVETAKDGNLPPLFQKLNENEMPVNLMISQVVLISILSFLFILMPSVNSSYWVLTSITAQLYLITYVMMFASAIKLRYSQPGTKRAFTVPGGTLGIWLIGGLGILTCIFATFIGILPPSQLTNTHPLVYSALVSGGILLVCLFPLAVMHLRKPDWIPIEGKQEKGSKAKKVK